MQIQTTAHFEIAMSDVQSNILVAAVSGDLNILKTYLAKGKKINKIEI